MSWTWVAIAAGKGMANGPIPQCSQQLEGKMPFRVHEGFAEDLRQHAFRLVPCLVAVARASPPSCRPQPNGPLGQMTSDRTHLVWHCADCVCRCCCCCCCCCLLLFSTRPLQSPLSSCQVAYYPPNDNGSTKNILHIQLSCSAALCATDYYPKLQRR